MCFSEMKPYPVLLEFKERTSMLCHLYRRKKNTGKCSSTKENLFRGWGGGSVSEGACPSSVRTHSTHHTHIKTWADW